jgi:hypothetical protein
MSIYCYINDNHEVISSELLVNIKSLNEFENFIKTKMDLPKDTLLYSYYCYSSLALENIMRSSKKTKVNYLVTTKNDAQCIQLLNTKTLYSLIYLIPTKMTYDVFVKVFNETGVKVFTKNSHLLANDTFNSNLSYYYENIW